MTWTNDAPESLTVPASNGPDGPNVYLGAEIPAELSAYYATLNLEIVAAVIWRLSADTYWYEAVIKSPINVAFSRVGRGGCYLGTVTEYGTIAWDNPSLLPVQRQDRGRFLVVGGTVDVEVPAQLRIQERIISGMVKSVPPTVPLPNTTASSTWSLIPGFPTRIFSKFYPAHNPPDENGTKVRMDLSATVYCNSGSSHAGDVGLRFTASNGITAYDFRLGKVHFSQPSRQNAFGTGCFDLPPDNYTVAVIWRRTSGTLNPIGVSADDLISFTVSEVDGRTT